MSSYYDNFDYPSYWIGREYEHKAEVIAVNSFLSKIPQIRNLMEIGSGYGRLSSVYLQKAKNIYLTDPSSKLLSLAGRKIPKNNVNYIHSSLENLNHKLKNKMDLIVMVRVLHHIKSISGSFNQIYNFLNPNGYLILEFANKLNLKSILREIIKGNTTVFFDIFPKDIRSNKSTKTIQFNNYHPGYVMDLLKNSGFEIIEVRSVSNIRIQLLKRCIPLCILCSIEKSVQRLFSFINFGPSTFVLAKKV